MKNRHTPDIRAIAREAVVEAGFEPDFPPEVEREVEADDKAGERAIPDSFVKDMRALLWSSIDNKESRDLDQIEYAERLARGGYRVLVGIADVDAFVPAGSAVDRHASRNTVSVYTPASVFPMLPEQLSTGLTSLLEGEDRLAVVMDLNVTGDGDLTSKDVYRAVVRNKAKMDYDTAGAWLEGRGPATRGRPRSLPGTLALNFEDARPRRVHGRSARPQSGGTLRPGRARLHALDRAQPTLPGPRHAALPEECRVGRARALHARRTR